MFPVVQIRNYAYVESLFLYAVRIINYLIIKHICLLNEGTELYHIIIFTEYMKNCIDYRV